jgi:hypothetical protein
MSIHASWFYYSVTGLNGAVIYGSSDQIVGSISNATAPGSISGFDNQNYVGIGGLGVGATVNYDNNLGYYNMPYGLTTFSEFGIPPQSGSDPSNLGEHSIDSFAYTTQVANLYSDTLLYYTAPVSAVPEPSSVMLLGTALAGVASMVLRKG